MKSRIVIRSVLGEKAFRLTDECDTAIILQHNLRKILGRTLKIKIWTANATLFNRLIRNVPSTEKILVIYIKAAIEAYNDGIINDII